MYYSAVMLPKGHEYSDKLRELKKAFPEIELLEVSLSTGHGVMLVEQAIDAGAKRFPFVLAGDKLVSDGEQAWVNLYQHWVDNPHVHWEASDAEV